MHVFALASICVFPRFDSEFPTMNRPIFAGVDVGGTNTKVGLLSENGTVVAHDQFPTMSGNEPSIALSTAKHVIHKLLAANGLNHSDLMAVGLATPGPMDIPAGMILTPFNLPGWRNQNVKQILEELTNRPVTFANDASAAAFGEYWIGSGSKYSSIVMFTLGTGVGGGIIIDGMSIDGTNSHGSEIGHIVIDCSAEARICPCGAAGHLEAYCSATGIVKRCQDLLDEGNESVLQLPRTSADELNTYEIYEAALKDDGLANKIITETSDYLACGIVSLAHVIDPAAVLLGGAVNFGGEDSPVGAKFIQRIRERVKQISLPRIGEALKIEFASLQAQAGFIGAAGMAKHEYDLNKNTITQ